MGEGPTSRESPYSVSCTFEALAKQKKNASVQGSLKFGEVFNNFWEGTRREKTRLKKVNYLLTYLLSQPFLDNHYRGYQQDTKTEYNTTHTSVWIAQDTTESRVP